MFVGLSKGMQWRLHEAWQMYVDAWKTNIPEFKNPFAPSRTPSQRIRTPPLIPSPTPISLLRRRQPFDAAEPLAIECLLHYECKQQEVSSWHNNVVNWSLLHRQVLALGGLLPRFHSGRGHSSYGSGNVSTHSQVQLHWLSASRICSNTEYLQTQKAMSTSAQDRSLSVSKQLFN
ncbi:uncharacterized protein [Triticum aestivum]|uniref:uncharacterized protein isoform X3 n=1 Tax=Triticum aestivum TaxID=4565 RepID=UPI001D02FD2B|nr:uncharacterized protein LOC123164580 isoform X3 [Triticum aestivum]